MSEARALTNFAGNAVATVLIGTWTGGVDREQLDAVLAGERPFDETTMLDEARERPTRLNRRLAARLDGLPRVLRQCRIPVSASSAPPTSLRCWS